MLLLEPPEVTFPTPIPHIGRALPALLLCDHDCYYCYDYDFGKDYDNDDDHDHDDDHDDDGLGL